MLVPLTHYFVMLFKNRNKKNPEDPTNQAKPKLTQTSQVLCHLTGGVSEISFLMHVFSGTHMKLIYELTCLPSLRDKNRRQNI